MVAASSDFPDASDASGAPQMSRRDAGDARGAPVRPFVQNLGNTRALHFSQKEIQSRMSLLNPDALDLEYTRMMMGFLLFNAQPAHITMVGLGGGSLPKFCHRYLPGATIDVIEIDADVIALREAFMVPPDSARFRVIHADAAEYMLQAQPPADVLLLDGFGEGGIPAALCTAAFYAACRDALTPDGVMVVNFHVNHPDHHDYMDRVRAAFGASMIEVVDDDMTNSVVFACKGEMPEDLGALALVRPPTLSKDAWRQLMPTFRVIAATMELR
ncbi:MAG: fused MFS/spermidine synthase [Achromobacter sp.]|jgi:spermidine synthase